MIIGGVFFWIALSIAVAVAANTRGRSGAGWFFLALLMSPLIAGLLVLALPSLSTANGPTAIAAPFVPQGVLDGIPYRLTSTGKVEAMLPGGRTLFKNLEHLAAATRGGSIAPSISDPADLRDYPNEHASFRYRQERSGQVSALTPSGDRVVFKDWKAFWDACQSGRW